MKKRIVYCMLHSNTLNEWGLVEVNGYEIDNTYSIYHDKGEWIVVHNPTGLWVARGKKKEEALKQLDERKEAVNNLPEKVMLKHIERFIDCFSKLERSEA